MAKGRDSGDSAVFNRPLSGGGEATGEDVEGHMMPKASGGPGLKAAGGPGLRAARGGVRATGDDDDTEGHAMKSSVRAKSRAIDGDDDTEGHAMKSTVRASRPALHATRGLVKESDEDVEGHAMKSTVRAKSRAIDGGDDDTEGHALRRATESGDEDTEGHRMRGGGPAPKATRPGGGLLPRAKSRASDDA